MASSPDSPDVAFGVIPFVGVAAAVTEDRPASLHEALHQYGFAYSPERDVYLLPPETGHASTVGSVAAAARRLQDAGWSVAADPRVAVPHPSAAPEPDGPVPGITVRELAEELPTLKHPSDVADRVLYAAHEQVGVLPQLQRFLATAADWCEGYPGPESAELAHRLRDLSGQTGLLCVQLTNTALDLDQLAPPTAAVGQDQAARAQHTARSHAATAPSPHRPSTTAPPTAPEAASSAAAPPTSRRHR